MKLKARRDGHRRLPAVKRAFRALTGLTDEGLSERQKLDEELIPLCTSFCEESPSDSFKVSASGRLFIIMLMKLYLSQLYCEEVKASYSQELSALATVEHNRRAVFLGVGNPLGLDFSELIDEPSINTQMSQVEAPNILVVAILPEVCEQLYEILKLCRHLSHTAMDIHSDKEFYLEADEDPVQSYYRCDHRRTEVG